MTNFRRALLMLALAALTGCAATDSRRSTGERVDDAALLTRVKSALIAGEDTSGLDIDVEVFRGRVQLNGTADSEAARQAATEVVQDLRGVVAVENNLRVAAESRRVGEYIDDKTLEARVAAALARSDEVSAMSVEVEAFRGEVSLGGFVASEQEKQKAGEIVSRVEHVRRVINNIAVRPPARR